MAIKMAARIKMVEKSEQRHSDPSSKNNSSDMEIVMARENSKKQAKKNDHLLQRCQKATAMRMADRRPSKNVTNVSNGKLINILTENNLRRGGSRAGFFYQQKKGSLHYQEQ